VRRKRSKGGPAVVFKAEDNLLLRLLPASLLLTWKSALEPVQLRAGQCICEPGEVLHHVYFPVTCIVSIMQTLADGFSAQIAMIGREGLVGVTGFMGSGPSSSSAIVQSEGAAWRIDAETIRLEFARGGALMHLLMRYTQAMLAQMAQTAVCNRHHGPEQQLCRYLLLTLDRLDTNEIVTTHEFVAAMLGVRRETVSEAASRMQALGAIRYRRGHIFVVNRHELEQGACECYAVVRSEYDRLLQRHPADP